MIELIRDPLWQFVGAVLALLALPTAIWIYLLQRPRKELAYGVFSSRRILSVASELQNRVVVTVDGNTVQDVHLVIFGVKNSGNVPITEADYLYTPAIGPGEETDIISADLSTFFPTNLRVSLARQSDKIEFNAPLLNPGDYFTVQALTSGNSPKFTPDFRLVGTSKTELLRRARPFSTGSDKWSIAFWIALLLFMILAGTIMDTVIKKVLFTGVPSVIILTIFYTWARSRFGTQASRYIDDV
jgi:hypothetical protein